MTAEGPSVPDTLKLLLDDTAAQLSATRQAVDAGDLVDLGDLLPRIETICAMASAAGTTAVAARLASLLDQLDSLTGALKGRIAVLTATDAPDPHAASALYRRASTPQDPGR